MSANGCSAYYNSQALSQDSLLHCTGVSAACHVPICKDLLFFLTFKLCQGGVVFCLLPLLIPVIHLSSADTVL